VSGQQLGNIGDELQNHNAVGMRETGTEPYRTEMAGTSIEWRHGKRCVQLDESRQSTNLQTVGDHLWAKDELSEREASGA